MSVELIVEDAEFVTMAPGSGADSMLVRDGRIAAVGPAAAVRAGAQPGAAVVRLDGATVIPGLIDAHCHVMNVGYLAAGADCSQPTAPDIAAIQARLRAAADGTPAGSWVMGSGYVEYKLAEQRHPTRADLDAAVPDRPVVIYHTSLHACVLNVRLGDLVLRPCRAHRDGARPRRPRLPGLHTRAGRPGDRDRA
jgi:predicted amidohydrolase YtcJ